MFSRLPGGKNCRLFGLGGFMWRMDRTTSIGPDPVSSRALNSLPMPSIRIIIPCGTGCQRCIVSMGIEFDLIRAHSTSDEAQCSVLLTWLLGRGSGNFVDAVAVTVLRWSIGRVVRIDLVPGYR